MQDNQKECLPSQEANICGVRQLFSYQGHVYPSGHTHVNFQFSLILFSTEPYMYRCIPTLMSYTIFLFFDLLYQCTCYLQTCLPRSHDICCQCCVSEFFFAIQEWIAIEMYMAIITLKSQGIYEDTGKVSILVQWPNSTQM